MPPSNVGFTDRSPKVVFATDAVIAAAGTTSAAIDLTNGTIVGVFIPAGFLGTTLKFKTSTTATGTFVNIQNADGTDVAYTVSASHYYYLDPAIFVGAKYLQLVSGTSETSGATITYAKRILQ